MASYEVIIVGSGPAGVAAGLELRDRNVLILDAGFQAPAPSHDLNQNLYDLKRSNADLSKLLLGEQFESLHNVVSPYLSPKLKSPSVKFVTQDWQQLCPVDSPGFDGVLSFAAGGLSNVWGAGVYRFNDKELEDFPIRASDLNPFYDRLTSEIGISGCDDDLTRFFGSTEGLLPPARLDQLSEELLQQYSKKKKQLSRTGIYIGKPRVALLTKALNERAAYDYYGLEFFKPNGPAVYNSSYTLRDLRKLPNITYRSGFLVERFEETPERVKVFAKNIKTNAIEEFVGSKLVLAAGTISTSKIVLLSYNDYITRLPLLDNAVSYIPFLAPRFIGAAQENRFFSGVQLNVVYRKHEDDTPIQGSFYGVMGLLRSDLLIDLPLSIKGNLTAAKYLTPALGVLYLLYPDYADPNNYLRLTPGGELELRYQQKSRGQIEREFISAFWRLGYLSLPALCKYPAPGNSFHYAGTLPMKADTEGKYVTSVNGLLSGTKHVYVVDGANFSSLPSKNHTFTIMANSMRIAHHLKRELPS
ncbi:MAG TPA: GMC oxidoreductase [Pyrinomonadaceae bacterium]|nr:GMC oxidoreductase [Pyrinomonadaceae bacterium]